MSAVATAVFAHLANATDEIRHRTDGFGVAIANTLESNIRQLAMLCFDLFTSIRA